MKKSSNFSSTLQQISPFSPFPSSDLRFLRPSVLLHRRWLLLLLCVLVGGNFCIWGMRVVRAAFVDFDTNRVSLSSTLSPEDDRSSSRGGSRRGGSSPPWLKSRVGGCFLVGGFHCMLYLGAYSFFAKHLYRDYEVRSLTIQHLFSITFTSCVSMLQLLMLELLQVFHPTLRKWVWNLDLVLVLALVYVILPTAFVHIILGSSESSSSADASSSSSSQSCRNGDRRALKDDAFPDQNVVSGWRRIATCRRHLEGPTPNSTSSKEWDTTSWKTSSGKGSTSLSLLRRIWFLVSGVCSMLSSVFNVNMWYQFFIVNLSGGDYLTIVLSFARAFLPSSLGCCVFLPALWYLFFKSGSLLPFPHASSVSITERLLSHMGVCGVTVVSALAGFGSVNYPYRNMSAFLNPVTQSQVAEVEQRLLQTLQLIADKKKQWRLLRRRMNPSIAQEGWTFSRGIAPNSGRPEVFPFSSPQHSHYHPHYHLYHASPQTSGSITHKSPPHPLQNSLHPFNSSSIFSHPSSPSLGYAAVSTSSSTYGGIGRGERRVDEGRGKEDEGRYNSSLAVSGLESQTNYSWVKSNYEYDEVYHHDRIANEQCRSSHSLSPRSAFEEPLSFYKSADKPLRLGEYGSGGGEGIVGGREGGCEYSDVFPSVFLDPSRAYNFPASSFAASGTSSSNRMSPTTAATRDGRLGNSSRRPRCRSISNERSGSSSGAKVEQDSLPFWVWLLSFLSRVKINLFENWGWSWGGAGHQQRLLDRECQQLQTEIQALENLSRELFVGLDDLVRARARVLYSQTVVGRFHNILGGLMTLVCIYRVCIAVINVLFNRVSTIDPATRSLTIVFETLHVPIDVPFWSPYVSLLLMGWIIALNIRGFIEKLLVVFRYLSTSVSSNMFAIIMSEVMGLYFSACALLMRMYLPEAYREAVSEVLGPSLDFSAFHLHSDFVFVVSCVASLVLIFFAHTHKLDKFKSS